MLCLKAATPKSWIDVVLADVDAVLVDHAHCEHKAAVTALAFVSKYPDDPELCSALSELAVEEAQHFQKMVSVIQDRGLYLGYPDKDAYVGKLLKHARTGPWQHRVDRLLVCALIEARSCERLKLLAENLTDPKLVELYDEFWRVEAGHHTLFIDLAIGTVARMTEMDRNEAESNVRARLDELAHAESELLQSLPVRPAIH